MHTNTGHTASATSSVPGGLLSAVAEDQHFAFRDFFDGLDEDGATAAELIHHVAVVNDLMMNVDRVAVGFESQLYDIDGAHHSGAKAARAYAHEGLGPVVGSMNLSQHSVVHKPQQFT